MTLLSRPGKRTGPNGKPLTSYGYRFWYRGQLYKRMVGHSRALAIEAEKRERARVELAAFEGQWGPLSPQLTPWAEAVKRFLEAKAHKASLAWNEAQLTWWGTHFAGRGITYLQEISPEAIDAGKAALAVATLRPATIQRYLAVLHTLCALAVTRWRVLRSNPVDLVDKPKIRQRVIRIPTAAEREALLEACDPDVRQLVLVALYTGLRQGAILQLTAEDLRARPGWIRGQEEKGDKDVWLPVVPALQAVFDSCGVIQGPLFRTPDGRPWSAFPHHRWCQGRERAGMTWLRFHDLRHTTGTILAEAGVPQRTIQMFLGHSSGKVTERYTHPQEAGLQEAAKALGRRLRTTNSTTNLTSS